MLAWVSMRDIRPAAVAGSWYPAAPAALSAAVDRYLADADDGRSKLSSLVAVVAPHAGLVYSGPVAAFAYAQVRHRAFDVAVLVGPSHFEAFDGVAVHLGRGFATPLGLVDIDQERARALLDTTPVVREDASVHAREHSLEMQLPFLCRVAPGLPIVPLLMGRQTPDAAQALAEGLSTVLNECRPLVIASTDLSHYHDAATAFRLDSVVIDCVSRLDADGLDAALQTYPHHACGGGPTVAVLRAAEQLGASLAVVLRYGDSGDVSGDKSSVVGYLAAAAGT